MGGDGTDGLWEQAVAALRTNDLGEWTRPAPGLYPHQWLWDSCFIAIGLRHLDVGRAQQELRSLVRGQWANGMLPHIVFSDTPGYHAGPELWQSERHPAAPQGVRTTAITQPPMLAEAVWRVGELLDPLTRTAWFEEMLPPLVRLHDWLYRSRDPFDEGLVYLVHPWECGLDNTPPWMDMLAAVRPPVVRIADALGLESWLERRRRDTRQVPAEERIRTFELFTLYEVLSRLRGCDYDEDCVRASAVPLVLDLGFNAILVRANRLVEEMADAAGVRLPPRLTASMAKSAAVFRSFGLRTGEFVSRDFRTREPIRQPAVAEFLALYSGALAPGEEDGLLTALDNPQTYGLPFGVPSAPRTSPYFRPRCYWQGPVWVNVNWLVIDGLRRHGHSEAADALRERTLAMVGGAGMFEYFSPLDGGGAGSQPFSWTAALTLDLLATGPDADSH